ASDRGYAGIVAENDLLTLSSTNNDYCEFNKLSNGIVAKNSILNISATWFDDMQPETAYNWLGDQGIGISNVGFARSGRWSSLHFTGFDNGINPNFNNMSNGIRISRGALTVDAAIMTNVGNGVIAKSLVFHPMQVVNSTISAR